MLSLSKCSRRCNAEGSFPSGTLYPTLLTPRVRRASRQLPTASQALCSLPLLHAVSAGVHQPYPAVPTLHCCGANVSHHFQASDSREDLGYSLCLPSDPIHHQQCSTCRTVPMDRPASLTARCRVSWCSSWVLELAAYTSALRSKHTSTHLPACLWGFTKQSRTADAQPKMPMPGCHHHFASSPSCEG